MLLPTPEWHIGSQETVILPHEALQGASECMLLQAVVALVTPLVCLCAPRTGPCFAKHEMLFLQAACTGCLQTMSPTTRIATEPSMSSQGLFGTPTKQVAVCRTAACTRQMMAEHLLLTASDACLKKKSRFTTLVSRRGPHCCRQAAMHTACQHLPLCNPTPRFVPICMPTVTSPELGFG